MLSQIHSCFRPDEKVGDDICFYKRCAEQIHDFTFIIVMGLSTLIFQNTHIYPFQYK